MRMIADVITGSAGAESIINLMNRKFYGSLKKMMPVLSDLTKSMYVLRMGDCMAETTVTKNSDGTETTHECSESPDSTMKMAIQRVSDSLKEIYENPKDGMQRLLDYEKLKISGTVSKS